MERERGRRWRMREWETVRASRRLFRAGILFYRA